MDAFTKRFYKKGNETNKKEGNNKQYPVGDKKKSVAKKMKPTKRLNYLRGELNKERISYGELAELQGYKKHLYDDPHLAEAAGISEEDFNRHQKKQK